MREIKTEIEINADAEKVWGILTDFDHYNDWNPYIVKASGKPIAGQDLRLTMSLQGGKERSLKPIVTKVVPNQEFRWQGIMYFAGLFDEEHIYAIEQIEPQKVRFMQRELYNGLLLPFKWKGINEGTGEGFKAMNEALKKLAEKG